jgi:hypothetical protein
MSKPANAQQSPANSAQETPATSISASKGTTLSPQQQGGGMSIGGDIHKKTVPQRVEDGQDYWSDSSE